MDTIKLRDISLNHEVWITCPHCKEIYDGRWYPDKCPSCKYER